jgi:hypothetical protein
MTAHGVSKSRLNRRHLGQFPGETLFDRVARAVCEAEVLPRKELLESWEFARRVRRRVRGKRVVELAGGHGLVSALLLLLDDTSPGAVCVDVRRPESNPALWRALEDRWPRLAGRLSYVERSIGAVEVRDDDLVVSVHACGQLTDQVLQLAASARADVAVMPCCHEWSSDAPPGLSGWMDGSLAQDVERAHRLEIMGYSVRAERIPAAITPKNRLLVGTLTEGDGA